jgi:hypothetical protein
VNQAMATHALPWAICRIAVAIALAARVVAAKADFVAHVLHHGLGRTGGECECLTETSGHGLVSARERLLERKFHGKPSKPKDRGQYGRARTTIFPERAYGQGTIADSRMDGSAATLPIGGICRCVTVGIVAARRAFFAPRARRLHAASPRRSVVGALLIAGASFAQAACGAVTAKAAAPVSRARGRVTVPVGTAEFPH